MPFITVQMVCVILPDASMHQQALAAELEKLGYRQLNKDYFDTLKIELPAHVFVTFFAKSHWNGSKPSLLWSRTSRYQYRWNNATDWYRRVIIHLCWMPERLYVEAIPEKTYLIRNLPVRPTSCRTCIQEISYGNRVDALHYLLGT